jgi:predicted DNA-binding protein
MEGIFEMVKDAVISIRVEPGLKAHLEEVATNRGMTLAAYVAEILATHSRMPQWTLMEPEVVHTNRTGTNIHLSVAKGWPTALLDPPHAERLAIELKEAAAAAKKLLK